MYLCVSLKASHLVVRILCLDGLEISLMATTVQLQEYYRVADHYGCHSNEECDPDCVGVAEDESEGGGARGGARGGDKTNLEVQVDGWKESEKSAKMV
jgi:hypothetical protein